MIQAIGLTSNSRKEHPPAVDDVSFEARAGRVTALLGTSGAGKTTALRLMLELEQGRGITYFRGRPLHRIPHPSREVGVLLGDVPGHPARTVRGHLRMLCAAAGVPVRRADEVLETVGLVSLRDERLGTLSRGMDRRLGLACALLADPHTLLLDDPADGLSARESRWLYGMLRAHAAQGGTVLLTTSDPKEAARHADRVVTLEQGRLVADQDVADFSRTRLRPRVAVRSPHAGRLAALLTKEARTARRSVEVVRESGNHLSVYGSTCADVGEVAFRHGILVHQLADETGDMGPGAGTDLSRGPSADTVPHSPDGDMAATGADETTRESPKAPQARSASDGEPSATGAPQAVAQASHAVASGPGPADASVFGNGLSPRAVASHLPADWFVPVDGLSLHAADSRAAVGASALGDAPPVHGPGACPPAVGDMWMHDVAPETHQPAPLAATPAGGPADYDPGRPDPADAAHGPHSPHPMSAARSSAGDPGHAPADPSDNSPEGTASPRSSTTPTLRPTQMSAVDALSALPPPISVHPAPSPLRPLRYELRRAAGIGTGFLTGAAVLAVSALTAVLLARTGHTPQPRLLAAWPRQLPLPPAALGAGLLGALAFGDEFRHPALAADRGTVPRRLGLLMAKLLVAGATALLLAVLTVGCDSEVLYLVYGPELAEVPADWLSLGASWLGLVVGCAWAGVLAAGIFRSTTAGLAAVVTVPVLVVPLVQKALSGPSVRTAAGFPLRLRELLLSQWPFGGERYLAAVLRLIAQPVGGALTLSLTALLCAYLLTTLRSRVR